MRLEEQELYRKVLLNYERVCFGNEVCFLLRDGKKKKRREKESVVGESGKLEK
jgi:hypothetical protein